MERPAERGPDASRGFAEVLQGLNSACHGEVGLSWE